MEPLCIRDALHLYMILAPHLPEVVDDDALDWIQSIIESMKTNRHRDYVDAVMLMSGKSLEELQVMESGDILSLFIDGLAVNKVVYLDQFCKVLGLNHG